MPPFDLNWPYAYGAPDVTATFRREPEDFRVDENLGFEPSGEGEHVFLHVRKRGDNTDWVARQIARLADVRPMDVGYCGLKDRNAVTTQWFSVYLPKPKLSTIRDPDWLSLNSESLDIINVSRHQQKLRRGQHATNRFEIRLRDISGMLDEERLEAVLKRGIPNYFGEQRFGHNGNNLNVAHELLIGGRRIKNRQKRGLMISAARSYLFNSVLAKRVVQGNWKTLLDGDVNTDAPTGPLWGRGRLTSSESTLALESEVLDQYQPWCEGLEHVGLTQERRPLVLLPQAPEWDRAGGDLTLRFSLPPGAYATAVLREIAFLIQPKDD